MRFEATSPAEADDGGSRPIQLQLTSVPWDEAPSYHALSYVWGDPTPKCSITVNGERFDLAENLHFALKQLSRALPDDAWFWIDAICVDQSNIEERSWQVGQMRDLFERAESVYASLGDSAEESDLFLNLVDSFGREAQEAGVLDLWVEFDSPGRSYSRIPDDPEEHPALKFLLKVLECKELRDPQLLSAMVGLLCRPNWFRAWIVQEIALARTGHILCGEKSVSLVAFHAALTAIYFTKISAFARRQPHWDDLEEILVTTSSTSDVSFAACTIFGGNASAF